MDLALVERARRGDPVAFELIVEDRAQAVYRLSLAILGNEADAGDATQETFVAAWKGLPKLRDDRRFDAWLQRLSINSARMVLRGRRRRHVRELAAKGIASERAPSVRPDLDDGIALMVALAHLPADQRALLALHHLEGHPIEAIAEILEVPPGTVKSRLFAARNALRLLLGGPVR